MHHRTGGIRLLAVVLSAALLAAALAACGSSSSSGDAGTLLRQTFSGPHTVNSGNLSFSLTVNPSGSKTLTGPITVTFGGPFQSLGRGRLPASNFSVSISALGKTGSLGIISTGSSGYVTLEGVNYQLPPATFQKLESSFAGLTSSPGGAGGSTLGKLGINPMRWLVNPSVVGNENVAGADTTHIRADVNVSALLADLSTFLQRAASLGVAGAGRLPTSISPATRRRIASEVRNPSFDVWTGTGDKTVRKLAIKLTLPVSGQISTLLGGLRSAGIGLTMQYADLNKPQTITPPTAVHPFAELAAKLRTLVQSLQGAVGAGAQGAGTTSSSSSTAGVNAYSQCIQSAGGDVAKMQKCASLLTGQ